MCLDLVVDFGTGTRKNKTQNKKNNKKKLDEVCGMQRRDAIEAIKFWTVYRIVCDLYVGIVAQRN